MSILKLSPSQTLRNMARSDSFYPLTSILQFILDTIALSLTAMAVSYGRFVYQGHYDPLKATKESISWVLLIVFLVQALVGYIVGIYRRKWRYGSFDEVAGLIVTTTLSQQLHTQEVSESSGASQGYF